MKTNLLQTAVAIGLGMSLMAFFVQPNANANLPMTGMGFGQNPITSIGGTAYDGENKLLLQAPSNYDIVVTDIILTSTSNQMCNRTHKSELHLGSGAVLGQFETGSTGVIVDNGTWGTNSSGTNVQHAFSSGIRIPAGDTMTFLVTETTNYTYNGTCSNPTMYGVRYMVSGVYVTPI